jgi:hypothetical protein
MQIEKAEGNYQVPTEREVLIMSIDADLEALETLMESLQQDVKLINSIYNRVSKDINQLIKEK